MPTAQASPCRAKTCKSRDGKGGLHKEMTEVVEFGPISMIAIAFPDVEKLRGELAKEIRRLSEAGSSG